MGRLEHHRKFSIEQVEVGPRVQNLPFHLIIFSLKQIDLEPPGYSFPFYRCRKKLRGTVGQKGKPYAWKVRMDLFEQAF